MSRTRALALAALVCLAGTSCNALGLPSNCGGTEVIANFRQVGDLVVAANVQSADVVVGTIQDIELDGWQARVGLCLNEGEEISADVKAVVRTTSLLGEKFVDLKPLSEGPPFLQDGDVLTVEQTGKATELEDVFARLASILGAGNLEQLNRFTAAQAEILSEHTDDLRLILRELHKFTDTLDGRRDQIGAAIDSLDAVARTTLADAGILEQFLESFAGASGVLADQKNGLQSLLRSLDRFTEVSVQLLRETQGGFETQFKKLRPVLRVLVENSANVRESIQTLATFAEYWPESMPGDYLQLDVCQASPDMYGQGLTCPQSFGSGGAPPVSSRDGSAANAVDLIMKQPLGGGRR
ncbi:MAG TPA: MCE family protein [Actinomycetota bacterium]|nr:MCE family protein [Actinomycetota bacterium]